MTDQPRSGADVLALAQSDSDGKPVVRTGVAHICMRPDLIDEWQTANDALIKSKNEDAGKQRLSNGGVSSKTRELAKRVRELEDEIEKYDVAFTFKKLDKARHSEILDEHPPREGNLLDYQVGYNREAVDNAIAYEALVDPVFDLCERKKCTHEKCNTWQSLLKIIGPGEWEVIVQTVREVGGAVTGAPKSVVASRILDRPGSASKRRAAGE